ncbi:MAG: ABC-2 type transporter [Chloroflexi bacterium]|nr:ABC-2 type transporter [Chloroflexota bacterium]
MIADVWTVMWKEWKEIFLQRGSLRGGAWNLLLMIGVFGVFLPLQAGRSWVESPQGLIYWAWVPLFLVTSVIADSFAGERERQTLETLLASRLSDRAILSGKVSAAVGYGWGLTMAAMLVGLVTVNLAHGRGELLLYPAAVFGGIMGLSLLASGLVAGVGVLVSLRASTVRQAAQTMSIAIMLLLFVPVFGVQALPAEWKARLAQAVMGADVVQIVLVAAAVLMVLDLGLLAAAMARFQRARLILD